MPRDLTPSLVLQLRAGEDGAGELLDRLYREPIFRVAFSYLGDPTEAEDAVQDVFLRVLAARQVPEQFRVWLFQVVRNLCLNRLRSRRRRKDRDRLPTHADVAQSCYGEITKLIEGERQDQVIAAVAALSQEHREVLHLRYSEGLSRDETAEVLGIPASVVKSRLFEALKKLRTNC
jgi:RNA polymerase sigma-70 factor (ECF subfamily)